MKIQKLLFLYLTTSSPDSKTCAWSLFDPMKPGKTFQHIEAEPPYWSVLEAMRDGWRLLQASPMVDQRESTVYRLGAPAHEFMLERFEEVEG